MLDYIPDMYQYTVYGKANRVVKRGFAHTMAYAKQRCEKIARTGIKWNSRGDLETTALGQSAAHRFKVVGRWFDETLEKVNKS